MFMFTIFSGDMSTFFTTAEKQKIILKELNSIRASEFDLHIPGYENYKLYPGKSISELKMYMYLCHACHTHTHTMCNDRRKIIFKK